MCVPGPLGRGKGEQGRGCKNHRPPSQSAHREPSPCPQARGGGQPPRSPDLLLPSWPACPCLRCTHQLLRMGIVRGSPTEDLPSPPRLSLGIHSPCCRTESRFTGHHSRPAVFTHLFSKSDAQERAHFTAQPPTHPKRNVHVTVPASPSAGHRAPSHSHPMPRPRIAHVTWFVPWGSERAA